MGVVYLAHDERLGRSVAVKTMSSVGGDETARKRFWREARAAASINHPNVCQLYEIGEDAGELFIAMELLEGEALGERLQRGPLSVAEALPIGLGILAALSALHGRGIVHRDLKPSNVFLTPHGVKLLDFGLARVSDSGPSPALPAATELTGTGMVLGTPAVHGARAGDGRGPRRAQRPVRGRRDPLRDARGPPRLRRPQRGRDPARDALRAAPGADRVAGRGGGRPCHPSRAQQAPLGAAGDGRGDGRGAARGQRHGGRPLSRPGPHPDARRGPAVSHPAPRSRHRLPGLQPP